MRLLHTENLGVVEFSDANVPPYAILSHTWEEEEVTLQDMQGVHPTSKKGYDKVKRCCAYARADGVEYARQAFASAPSGVFVYRFTASQSGKITFDASLSRSERAKSRASGSDCSKNLGTYFCRRCYPWLNSRQQSAGAVQRKPAARSRRYRMGHSVADCIR